MNMEMMEPMVNMLVKRPSRLALLGCVSNVAEVILPVVVLLQEVEKGSGVGREVGSGNAPFSTRGMYIP